VGYPNAKIPMTSVHGIRVAGGTFPATIWRLFMTPAFANDPPSDWPPPDEPVIWKPFHGQYEYVGPPPGSGGGEPEPPKEKDGGKTTEPATTSEEPPATTTGPAPGTTTTE
jgi:hypothetical protein